MRGRVNCLSYKIGGGGGSEKGFNHAQRGGGGASIISFEIALTWQT